MATLNDTVAVGGAKVALHTQLVGLRNKLEDRTRMRNRPYKDRRLFARAHIKGGWLISRLRNQYLRSQIHFYRGYNLNWGVTQRKNKFRQSSSCLWCLFSFFRLHKGGPPFVLASTSPLSPCHSWFCTPMHSPPAAQSPHPVSINGSPMPVKYRLSMSEGRKHRFFGKET